MDFKQQGNDRPTNGSLKFAVKTDLLLGMGLVYLILSSQIVGCGPREEVNYGLSQNDYKGKIRINMPQSAATNITNLIVAAPPGAVSLKCSIGLGPCFAPTTTGESGIKPLTSINQAGKTQYFIVNLSNPLASDSTLKFEAFDSTSKSIDVRSVTFTKGAPQAATTTPPAGSGTTPPATPATTTKPPTQTPATGTGGAAGASN